MNAIRKTYRIEKETTTIGKPILTLANNEKQKDNTVKYSKDYLNEKMYYFYNNGGPVMDI